MVRYFALLDGHAGAYSVIFPDLLGCTAMGDTVDMALTNALAAARDWLRHAEPDSAGLLRPRVLEALREDREVSDALVRGAALVLMQPLH